MPEFSRFLGIVIAMFFNDHNPPISTRTYGEHEAAVSIRDGAVLWGSLPRRALGHVQEWRQAHLAELEDNWERARAKQLLQPIAPLE
jgi:hypothetical protein